MRIGRTQSSGHPDRACDLIAETVVDEYLRRDPTSSLRVHVTGGKGALFVSGVVSSKADFDVGAIVQRAAAQLGARQPIEPFVALEPAAGSVLLDALRSSRPIGVMGYATRETAECLPRTVALSRRIAKKLEDLRVNDPEWFWFDPSFEVGVVEAAGGRRSTAYVTCAHGDQDVTDVRVRVAQALSDMVEGANVRVNASGPLLSFGLDHDIGSSGVSDEPYGS
ncbi:MAG TPA: S-adenosylmethionine synthetase N-terminal domain-containing protein, partial [Candidatus Methylomirabilis sp.]|nr:S-adenosylmethionine synthetase N-terminal domain-containing protein [Candidatus Methylomirabilis sp.]